jgi:plastocyanin
MKKVLTVGMALTVAACLMGTATASARPQSPQGTQAMAKVKIVNFAFKPATLNIAAGTTVIWKNTSLTSHTVTSDTGAFDSGIIAGGAKYKHRFKKPGTFAYHCSIHPQMTASVVVSAP